MSYNLHTIKAPCKPPEGLMGSSNKKKSDNTEHRTGLNTNLNNRK